MKRANITNGEYFNEYFESKYGENGIPFNEAMMVGSATMDILTDQFPIKRAAELHVSIQEYRQKLQGFFTFLHELAYYDEVVLWFGDDAFCQLNLLTVLSFLEVYKYEGNVFTVIIDDETQGIVREKMPVFLGRYKKLYDKIIVEQKMVEVEDSIMNRAIALYFDYLSDSGKMAMLVKNNAALADNELVKILLFESKEYGISDLQVYELIKQYR